MLLPQVRGQPNAEPVATTYYPSPTLDEPVTQQTQPKHPNRRPRKIARVGAPEILPAVLLHQLSGPVGLDGLPDNLATQLRWWRERELEPQRTAITTSPAYYATPAAALDASTQRRITHKPQWHSCHARPSEAYRPQPVRATQPTNSN